MNNEFIEEGGICKHCGGNIATFVEHNCYMKHLHEMMNRKRNRKRNRKGNYNKK